MKTDTSQLSDTEIRKIINERDLYKRIALAYERKYGPVARRSSIIIVRNHTSAAKSSDGKRHANIETFFCEDSRDSVADTRFLRGVYDELVDDLACKATEIIPSAGESA